MPTFTAFGADILSNPNVNTVGGAGEDGAGQITVSPGSVLFPADYFIEFEVDSVLANGEFDGSTAFIGMKVYASQADFIAGTPLYTYAPQNPGQTAAIQNSVDGIGDTYVRFNGSVLLSVDAGAPSLQNIFVAPGSGVAVGTTTVFDHHTDVDYDGNGTIDATPIEDGNGFFNIANTQAVCFTHDTMMLTPSGERPINDLRVGDYVTTADNGPQKIIWIGSRIFNQRSLLETPKLRPVFIPQGVLGATKPTLVSRQHAILGNGENLTRAIKLTRKKGARLRVANGVRSVQYFHIMCENHEVLFGNGVASESYYPGKQALRMLTPWQRNEMFQIFPQLQSNAASLASLYGQRARQMV